MDRFIALAVVVLAVTSCSTTFAANLEVGDCLIEPDGDEFTTVQTIDCAEPHDLEVYAVYETPMTEYLDIEVDAVSQCLNEFRAYVGVAYRDSEYEFDWLQPTEEGWDDGDREIRCILWSPTGQTSGSALDSNR